MGGGHQRDLLPLRIAALGALEIRADRRRTAGRASWRSQAKPCLVHKLGCFGGTTPALRNSARTVFLALVRLAITWLRQLINSRQFRTSSEGTCTVGVSPKYSNFASRSAS